MKNEILQILEDILPNVDFRGSDHLADDKILDSISIVSIVSELTVEYDIDFSFEDLVPENFNSVDAIAALVERKIS